MESFSVYQDVDLSGPRPTIANVVDFGAEVGYLNVSDEMKVMREIRS